MSARAKRKADRETKELIKEATSRIEKKLDAHSAEAKRQLAAARKAKSNANKQPSKKCGIMRGMEKLD